MINKLRKYCCDKLMDVKGVFDVDKKSHGILYRCLCCGSYEEIEINKKLPSNRGNIGVTEIGERP